MLVAATIALNPDTSTRRLSVETDVSRSSAIRILKKDLRLKPYTPRLVQRLSDGDAPQRAMFCALMDNQAEEDPGFLNKIVWSDEASFHISGVMNRHNAVYYSTDNPHVILQRRMKEPGVMVWGAMTVDGLVGPYFFDGSVTGASYLEMLSDFLLPRLQERDDFNQLWFQQDGAPAHFSIIVRDFLDQVFPQRWIGRMGAVSWPARSPDLSPLDFFLWGYLKDYVYARKPATLIEMRQFIQDGFAAVDADKELCRKVCLSSRSRFQECLDVQGAHFEQLR